MLETIICIQKKLYNVLIKESKVQSDKKLMKTVSDITGYDKIIKTSVDDLQYGIEQKSSIHNFSQARKALSRIVGIKPSASEQKILKTFHDFDSWTQQKLDFNQVRNQEDLGTDVFETNFNANTLANRRIERSLFLRLGNSEDQLTNFYKHRYNTKSNIRLNLNGLKTKE